MPRKARRKRPKKARFDAFLSHNSKDKPAVRELDEALGAYGVRPWLDERDLVPGQPWQEALEEVVLTTKAALVVFGPAGLGPWQSREMRICLSEFVRRKLPVIPVLLPGAPRKPKLPLFLKELTWVDLRSGLTDVGIEQLVRGITGRKPKRRPTSRRSTGPLSDHRLAELTAYARQSIAAEATRWLDTECAPFVVPPLLRLKPQAERQQLTDPREQWEPLSDEDMESVVHGRLPAEANRVRIVGDSGMGKTALLHYCAKRIALADDGCLPVRIEGLSGYDWTRSRSELLEMIAERVLHNHLPDDAADNDRSGWLKWLVDGGRLVFLLDALDQTDDQLNRAGLRGFLQCRGVAKCPVLITLRPEVEGSEVFAGTHWATLRTGVFDEPRQREFLGEVAGVLLPTQGESWQAPGSYERKMQWPDLLAIPLLLKMMRDLAIAQSQDRAQVSLRGLHSRYAVYREAVAHLVKKGLATAEAAQFRGKLQSADDAIDFLVDIGWRTVCQGEGNFTAVLDGRPFQELRREQRDLLPALKQVDLVTRHAVLDGYGDEGLAWRHRSFSEYFAGLQLAGMPVDGRRSVLEKHARDPRWQWVFRFALGETSRASRGSLTVRDETASELIRFGNPFLLFDAIDQDGIAVPDHLERLCRWLVHQDWSWGGRDYRDAWRGAETPSVDRQWISILGSLFERPQRDSRCLHAAWQLVERSDEPWAVGIRQRFLGEFSAMLADSSCLEHAAALELVAAEAFERCPLDPGEDGKPFRMGSTESTGAALERPQHEVCLTPFHLQRTPISNSQFELFDPSHRYRRDNISPGDDHPAVWINWYMAGLFCVWLGEWYRLPTEAEWEYACRAGTTTQYSFGDDAGSLAEYAWFTDNSGGQTQPVGTRKPNPWGLYDMHGNVREWCREWFSQGYYAESPPVDPTGPSEGSSRVFRGGSWISRAEYCRSACRLWHSPEYRNFSLGFRVARSPSGESGQGE